MIAQLADSLNSADPDARKKHLPDRSLELHLLDVDMIFRGRIHDGDLVDIVENPANQAKPNFKLTMTSDDLREMTEGRLKFATAWATGRVRLDAGFRDLLRLRTLL